MILHMLVLQWSIVRKGVPAPPPFLRPLFKPKKPTNEITLLHPIPLRNPFLFPTWTLFLLFFFNQDFLSRTLKTHSTTSTCSRTFRYLFAALNVRWLSHIFNLLDEIFPPYRITIWWIDDVKFVLVCLLDDLILQSWPKYFRQTVVFLWISWIFASTDKILILGARLSKRL